MCGWNRISAVVSFFPSVNLIIFGFGSNLAINVYVEKMQYGLSMMFVYKGVISTAVF